MCELLALHSNAPTAATFSFTGLAERGGRTGDHVDGWGMGFHDGDRCHVITEDRRACDSPLAGFLRRHPIRARTVLAHIRKATQGAVNRENCHPFRREWAGRSWLFAHNGNLVDYQPQLDGAYRPVGQTDSERAFCALMQRLANTFGNRLPGWDELAPALADWVAPIAAHGTFNLLLTDGRAVFTHASTKLSWVQRQHPFRHSRLVDCDLGIDLAEHHAPTDRTVVVATAPLTRDEAWQAYAPGEMRLFAEGRCTWARGAKPAAAPAPAAPADWPSDTRPMPI